MKRADMRRMLRRTPPGEALKRLFDVARVGPLPCELINIEESVGRVLAKDLVCEFDIPHFDKAYIDGYAVQAEDTKTASIERPVMLNVVGKLFPSDYPTSFKISQGQAAYVSCGAPIPQGADAVVRVEETLLREGRIEIRRAVKIGEGIILAGDDVKRESLILKKGHVLRPQDVGLLSAIQMREVEVFKRPKVAIISVGDELVELGVKDPTKTVNNYALIVSGLVSELGAMPLMLGIARDDQAIIEGKIREALGRADIVVTIGGCSVGVRDFVPDAINALGKPGVVVHGILIRPGSVSGFGVVNGKPIIMLPGHIISCIVGFYLFVTPLISVCAGLGVKKGLFTIRAKISQEFEGDPHFFRFLRVCVKEMGKTLVAEPVEGGANTLSTFVNSNGFTIVPPRKKFQGGEEINVVLFTKQELGQFSILYTLMDFFGF